MGKKWGESFLKSGLPLEHLTTLTFRSLGWPTAPHFEYEREHTVGQESYYELDLLAYSPKANGDTWLSFLVECKYHDKSRFWIFLPCDSVYWEFDDRVFNCGPLQTLSSPRSSGAVNLAPRSRWGVVVSEDGQRQPNAVETAVQQLAHGFVATAWMTMFRKSLDVVERATHVLFALVPMIVTNARVFRLKPEVRDLDAIRDASTPEEIADEPGWTWCYYNPSMALFDRNLRSIRDCKATEGVLERWRALAEERFDTFSTRPNWIAVANLVSLKGAVEAIYKYFMGLQTRSATI